LHPGADLEPEQDTHEQKRYHRDKWQGLAAGCLDDVAEGNGSDEACCSGSGVEDADHGTGEGPASVEADCERYGLLEGDAGDSAGQE